MDLTKILKEAKTIIIVGCSGRRTRPSYSVSRYLLQNGYRIVPVNPNYDSVHEQLCYPDLASVPEDVESEIINIFRNPRHAAGVVREVVGWAETARRKPVIWTQIGVSSPEAERIATEAGLGYVANRCIMMEHIRIASSTAEPG